MSSIILAAASAMNSASISNSVTTTDPYAANTVLLLNGEGAIDGAQNNTFVDSSGNNLAITRYGNVTQGSFSPFPVNNGEYNPAVHGGSAYFDGTGDYLTIPASPNLAFNGDFTVEEFVYINSYTLGPIIQVGGYTDGVWLRSTTGTEFAVNGSFGSISNYTSVFPLRTWLHVAITRSGNLVRLFVNGVLVSSITVTGTVNSAGNLQLGLSSHAGGEYFNGYISNLRIVKGTALYTSNFTPSTTPLTAVPGTSLLLNFTNAGIYDLTGKNNLETVGNAQISTGVKKYGSGAMYFDGTEDYITFPLNLDPFSVWTYETWIYPNSSSGYYDLLSSNDDKTYIDWLGSTFYVAFDYDNLAWTIPQTASTWTHVAVVFNTNTATVFINGISQGTKTTSMASRGVLSGYIVGRRALGYYPLNGYIDDLRITKGIARYTANFTPPNESLYLSKTVSNEVYGIDWNPTTDMYTRTGIAAGTSLGTSYNGNIQSRMKRCVLNSNGTVKYYLNPTNSTKKEDGTTAIIDGSDGNVMVEIPKFYYKYENVSGVHKWSISPVPSTGYTVHPAFIKTGVEVANRYYPAYEGYSLSGRLISGSGRTPTVSQTRATFRGYARANGTGWGLIDWNILTAVQLLFVTEYGTFNTQNILGNGNDTGGDYTMITGGSNSIGNASSPATNDDTWMSYRGIENWYASMWKFIDGVNVSERRYFVSNNPTTFADDVFSGDYINTGITSSSSNGYVTNFVASGLGFVPSTVGGTASTYVGDYFYQSTGNRVVFFGGSAGVGLLAGGFCVYALGAASSAGSAVGSGVCF